MGRNKKFLLSSLLVFVFTVCIGYIAYVHKTTKTSVKGVSSIILPTSTVVSSLTPTQISTSTPADMPLSKEIKSTPQAKQYGGWYWQPELNRAQVFIGTDSAGKDIWIDGFPAPTQIPTPKTATKQLSTQGTVSNTSGMSSMGNMTQEVQTKIVEKK